MQYFVTSADAAAARQIGEMLVQLRQECPPSNILQLNEVIPALEASVSTGQSVKGANGPRESAPIVVVVLMPDSERALAVVRDIHRRTTARILAVGPATDPKLVLRAMRDGATEYLDQAELRTELSEALQRLDATGRSGLIIALLAPCGGSGASTLAVNVATALALKHAKCALVDLKLEAGDLAPLLDLKPNHTLADLCQNMERMDFSLLQACLAHGKSGVQLLAAPARLADVSRVTPQSIDLVLPLVSRHFPFVVIDVDHTFRAEQGRALLQADVIGLVLRLDFISLRNARNTFDYFQQIGVSRDKVRVIANQAGAPSQLSASQAEESLGVKIYHSIPDDPRTVNRANNDGTPVVLQAPSARVSRSLVELAMRLSDASK